MVFIQHSDVPIHPGWFPCTHDDGRAVQAIISSKLVRMEVQCRSESASPNLWTDVSIIQVSGVLRRTPREDIFVCAQSPAGGSLVDACCLPGASGGLCVAAAGKWAVCLWSQTSPSDWTLKHTWSFSEVSVCTVEASLPVSPLTGLLFFFFLSRTYWGLPCGKL